MMNRQHAIMTGVVFPRLVASAVAKRAENPAAPLSHAETIAVLLDRTRNRWGDSPAALELAERLGNLSGRELALPLRL
ncbi:hypothetical protein [Azospirillum sp. TSH64]|jgi:hypothetical protein|uniref:hypothetical protein n=1 Tax=Azospirillum sp. TSH64 TaxID=652740 RepID=UPI000D60BF07|nr:hypothetical protein [Azospirillum sp. TSH64]PWC81279.1 hypothetical protein TSH64_01170 [Azospirillum sp. TSH64]